MGHTCHYSDQHRPTARHAHLCPKTVLKNYINAQTSKHHRPPVMENTRAAVSCPAASLHPCISLEEKWAPWGPEGHGCQAAHLEWVMEEQAHKRLHWPLCIHIQDARKKGEQHSSINCSQADNVRCQWGKSTCNKCWRINKYGEVGFGVSTGTVRTRHGRHWNSCNLL